MYTTVHLKHLNLHINVLVHFYMYTVGYWENQSLSHTFSVVFPVSWVGSKGASWGVMSFIADDNWFCCVLEFISPKEACRKLPFFRASFSVDNATDDGMTLALGFVDTMSTLECLLDDGVLCDKSFVTGAAVVTSDSSSSSWVSSAWMSFELSASSDLTCSYLPESVKKKRETRLPILSK